MGRIRNEFDSRDISVYPSVGALPPASQFGVGVAQAGSSLHVSNGLGWSAANNKYDFGNKKPGFIQIGDSLQSLGNKSGGVVVTATVGALTANVNTGAGTFGAHSCTAGLDCYITNVNQTEFDGLFKIATVVDANNFTINLTSPATVATATSVSNIVCTIQQRVNDTNQTFLANAMSGSPALYLGNLAAGGAKSSEVLARLPKALLPKSNIWGLKADIVFCSVLTNDSVNDEPVETVKNNILSIINTVSAAGMLLVLDNGWPINNTVGTWSINRIQNHFAVSKWITDLALTDTRFILNDTMGLVADKTNQYNNYKSGYGASDGIHKSKIGAYWVAKQLKTLIFDKIISVEDRTLVNIATNNVLAGTSGTVSGTGGSGSAATSWTLQSLGGGSQTVVGAKGIDLRGNAESQRATVTAAASLDRCQFGPTSQISSSVSAGQKYIFKSRVRSSSLTGSWRYVLQALNVTVSGFSGTFGGSESNGTDGWPEDFDLTLETPLWTVPSGLTSLNARIDCAFAGSGSGVFDFSDVSIFMVY